MSQSQRETADARVSTCLMRRSPFLEIYVFKRTNGENAEDVNDGEENEKRRTCEQRVTLSGVNNNIRKARIVVSKLD